jgi:hypothetical protein
VGEAVAHSSNVLPRDTRLFGQGRWADALHGFADLDQSQSDGIENETVAQIASLPAAPNRLDGVNDVVQSLSVVTTNSGMASLLASARTLGRRLSDGTTSTFAI